MAVPLVVTAGTRERITIGDPSSISSRTKSPSGVRPPGFFSFLGYAVRVWDGLAEEHQWCESAHTP
jgi:hypothetical protein